MIIIVYTLLDLLCSRQQLRMVHTYMYMIYFVLHDFELCEQISPKSMMYVEGNTKIHFTVSAVTKWREHICALALDDYSSKWVPARVNETPQIKSLKQTFHTVICLTSKQFPVPTSVSLSEALTTHV